MAVFTHIKTDSGTNADISSATAIGTYTATADKLVMVDVSIDQVAGDGDYVMYVTRQINGAGSAYRILPQTTLTAASGLTAISAQSGWITVRNGDVLTCYVDGLAGDTSTPDWTTRWFEDSGKITGVTLADDAITAAKFDESTAFPIKSADAGSTMIARAGSDSFNLTDINHVLIYDGVMVNAIEGNAITAAGLNADAVTKIQSGLALEATLTAIKGTGWTNQTLVKIVSDIAAISAGSGATAQEVWEYATRVLTAGTNIDLSALATATDLATVDTVVDAIKAKTDNLPASPAAVGSAMTLTAAYDKAKDDVLTPLGVVDGIVDAIKVQTDKIPAAPAQTGEYNAALTAIQADLDNPDQYKADVSGLATSAEVGAIPTTPLLAANYVAPNNSGIAAIKAKTDNLPANTATALAAIQSDLDNPAQYKADVSGLATTAHVQEVENKIDAIDITVNTIPTNPLLDTAYTAPDNAGIAAIQEKTEQLTFTAPNKVDASATVDPTGIATSEELDIIGEKVDGVLNKLNVSSVEFVTAVVGSNITILRGDTLAARLLDLGDLTQYANLDFTVKRVAGELDDAAKIRLRKNASGTDDGLLRINGAEYATATDGSIVIDDLTTGDIEIKLNAAATRELVPGNYVYDVQIITANEVRTLTTGKATVTADVTRATS